MALTHRLKGHESFIPREGWITKALFAIQRDPMLFTVASGADALGVGTNMAKINSLLDAYCWINR